MVAALIAATGTAFGGSGAVVSAVLSRRSAREAGQKAAAAQSAAAGVEAQKAGYEVMELSLRNAHREIRRLNRTQDEDRRAYQTEIAALRTAVKTCDDERAALLLQVRRFTNGA